MEFILLCSASSIHRISANASSAEKIFVEERFFQISFPFSKMSLSTHQEIIPKYHKTRRVPSGAREILNIY